MHVRVRKDQGATPEPREGWFEGLACRTLSDGRRALLSTRSGWGDQGRLRVGKVTETLVSREEIDEPSDERRLPGERLARI